MAGFFARAGMVETLDGRTGSVTLLLSVSPAGGDFTEPVTQACLRTTGALLMLDSALAHRRHFPAIDWFRSFSLYESGVTAYFDRQIAADWSARRQQARTLLQEAARLREVAEIVGTEGLQDADRRTMNSAEQIRRDFLMQNAYTDDAYSPPADTYRRIAGILDEHARR
jgi:V/A-type H+-transporting ATPase subunit A